MSQTAVKFDAVAFLRRDVHVVVQVEPQMMERLVDTAGEFPVRQGGPERAAGMIVHENETAGLVPEHELHYLQRFQRYTVKITVMYLGIDKQSVLLVQKRDPGFLFGTYPEAFLAHGDYFVKRHGTLLLYGALQSAGNDFPDERAETIHRLTASFHGAAFGIASAQHGGDGAEVLDEAFGQHFVVAPQIDMAKRELKQLAVGKRGGIGKKAGTQAGAMPGAECCLVSLGIRKMLLLLFCRRMGDAAGYSLHGTGSVCSVTHDVSAENGGRLAARPEKQRKLCH